MPLPFKLKKRLNAYIIYLSQLAKSIKKHKTHKDHKKFRKQGISKSTMLQKQNVSSQRFDTCRS